MEILLLPSFQPALKENIDSLKKFTLDAAAFLHHTIVFSMELGHNYVRRVFTNHALILTPM